MAGKFTAGFEFLMQTAIRGKISIWFSLPKGSHHSLSLSFSHRKRVFFFSLLGEMNFILFVSSAVMVVSVWNFSGSVDIDKDGGWIRIGDKRRKPERHPSPVS